MNLPRGRWRVTRANCRGCTAPEAGTGRDSLSPKPQRYGHMEPHRPGLVDGSGHPRSCTATDGTTTWRSAALTSSFHDGAWMTFPIDVAPGGTITITIDHTAGYNAVLSTITLGGPLVSSPSRDRRDRLIEWTGRGGTESSCTPWSPNVTASAGRSAKTASRGASTCCSPSSLGHANAGQIADAMATAANRGQPIDWNHASAPTTPRRFCCSCTTTKTSTGER